MPHPSVSVRRGVALAALALLAGACARDVLDPASRAADTAPHLSAAADGRPTFVSNAVKYRDLGAKPATGRSGSSTLAVRALLGRDGGTDLEVTTGTFDPVPTATRPLTRVQVKQLDSAGSPLRTLNYNALSGGGTAAFRYDGLSRGGKLQVQGNVTEGQRTDVVTVTGTVLLRPDLRVRLEAPANAAVGMPTNFVAVVSEGNGDVGARADCVLYVDGVEADRAPGIWVDAGDAVSCLLSHSFATVGEKHLRVEVAGVEPADFDPSNNHADATVQVSGNGDSDFDYYAQVWEREDSSIFADSAYLVFDSGQLSNQVTVQHQSARYQSSEFNGWMFHGISLAGTSIHVSQSTGGSTVHTATWPEAVGHEYPPLSGMPDCMSRWSDGVIFYLCSTGPGDPGLTNFQYIRFGVAVAYHSVQHMAFWWPDAPDAVWSQVVDLEGGWGADAPMITIGPDYSFLVEVTDGSRIYRTSATVQLGQPETSSWTYYPPDGTVCTSEYVPDPGFQWNLCRYHRGDTSMRTGWAFHYTE
jgi:hypothetical protein